MSAIRKRSDYQHQAIVPLTQETPTRTPLGVLGAHLASASHEDSLQLCRQRICLLIDC